jgi:carbon-monoxide dehydrogenase small subunit
MDPTEHSYELGLTINGENRSFRIEARTLLVHLLRDQCGLTGTKLACDTSQCGACTVLVDGQALKSCSVLAVRLQGADVQTIEGLAQNGELHPVQRAFVDNHGLQCGYCTPGMILTSIDLLSRTPDPTDEEIRHALSGNLCRCTGYQTIVESVRAAATGVS